MESAAAEIGYGWRMTCPAGLGFGEAFQLARVAQACPAEIRLLHDGYQADAKNLISILKLGVCPREVVTVVASGAEADAALAGLKALADISGPPIFTPEFPPGNDEARRPPDN